MKIIKTPLCLIAFFITSSLGATAPKQKMVQVNIQNYDVYPTAYNAKAKKINCSQFIDQTYQVLMVNGNFALKGQFELKGLHSYSITRSHGLVSTHWSGTWVYYQPNGKAYTSKIFGADVLFNGATAKIGVFKNKYCKGSYRIAPIPEEKPLDFRLPVVS